MHKRHNTTFSFALLFSTFLSVGCGDEDCPAISLPSIRVKVVNQANNIVEPDVIQLSRRDVVVDCIASESTENEYHCFASNFVDGLYVLKVEWNNQTFEKEYSINFDECNHPEIEHIEVVTFNAS